MADNTAILDGAGASKTFASDDISSVFYPRVKVTWGPDGTANDTDVASGKPIPAQLRVSDGTAWTYGAGASAAGTPRVTLASDAPGVVPYGAEYETVAASQTAQTIGPTGATGDYISHLVVTPASTSPGNVLILDNATSITVFAGGASSVSNLIPFSIPLGMISVSGAWKVTTGANVSVIAVGLFT